jgi:hypothetical protein
MSRRRRSPATTPDRIHDFKHSPSSMTLIPCLIRVHDIVRLHPEKTRSGSYHGTPLQACDQAAKTVPDDSSPTSTAGIPERTTRLRQLNKTYLRPQQNMPETSLGDVRDTVVKVIRSVQALDFFQALCLSSCTSSCIG